MREAGIVEWNAESACDVVTRAVRECLPPDAPPLCTLKSASWRGKGRNREAVGNVTMFDGRPARVAIGVHEMAGLFGWTMRWLDLPGGGVSLDDGVWAREDGDFDTTPATPPDTGTGATP